MYMQISKYQSKAPIFLAHPVYTPIHMNLRMSPLSGWYSDIDTLIMKPLTDFSTDVISTDSYFPEAFGKTFDARGHERLGVSVANGLFRFARAESPFLRQSINRFKWGYAKGKRAIWAAGSKVMTQTLRVKCGIDPREEGLQITGEY